MNDQQLQEAIDKTRAWLLPQTTSETTPSFKAKESAVLMLTELQKIQVVRAGLVSYPTVRVEEQS